ncbi:hypothetical protein GPECTOR_8g197 [Gonium pectorale]|uniref:F-box domain-containing protein n=1 Tax=Gonium pectorale TaxID=33097 RepID=A0A150GSM5_GONPE|nr:hypothetical protein GPECTOR_8g197 [Gonium pectorale]|eukprot:KXZ52811.1 hypothetical protein GPECTOR_8g197 [Gonium pectorale]
MDGKTSSQQPTLRRSTRVVKKTSKALASQEWPASFAVQAPAKPEEPCTLAPQNSALALDLEPDGASTANLQCGLWSLLPDELMENILNMCTTQQLGMLETTCSYFRRSSLIDRIAKLRLKAVPRARGLKPNRRDGENTLSLLHFVNSQSTAAAQGALGTGDKLDRCVPTKVDLSGEDMDDKKSRRAVQVSCGSAHTLVLVLNNGRMEVRTTGANAWGQLGQGDRKERCRLARTVVQMPGVVAVQCGDEHSAAITCRGVLYMWGRGDCGQLGLGDEKAKWKPTALRDFKVVHPEKTLRRSKRSLPVVRPVEPETKRQRMGDVWHAQ